MKSNFLYSQSFNPQFHHNLHHDVLFANHNHNLEILHNTGESFQYSLKNVRGEILAITSNNSTLVVAENLNTINLHIFTIEKIGKTAANTEIIANKKIELNSLANDIYSNVEIFKTYLKTLPNQLYFDIKSIALNDFGLLAILLPNKVLILDLATSALHVSDENQNFAKQAMQDDASFDDWAAENEVEINNLNTNIKSFTKICWDPSSNPSNATIFYLLSPYKIRKFKLDLINGCWRIVNQLKNYAVDNQKGELIQSNIKKYVENNYIYEQDVYESKNSSDLIDEAINKLNYKSELEKISAENLDIKITKFINFGANDNFTFVLTNKNNLYAIQNNCNNSDNGNTKIFNFFREAQFKKGKNYLGWSDYIQNLKNSEQLIDILDNNLLIDILVSPTNKNQIELKFNRSNLIVRFGVCASSFSGGVQNNFNNDNETGDDLENSNNSNFLRLEQVSFNFDNEFEGTIDNFYGNFALLSDNTIIYNSPNKPIQKITNSKPNLSNLTDFHFISQNEISSQILAINRNQIKNHTIYFFNAKNFEFLSENTLDGIGNYYNKKSDKNSEKISSIVTFGNILLIGSNNGMVYLYVVESDKKNQCEIHVNLIFMQKLFEDGQKIDLLTVNRRHFAVSSSSSDKCFIFNMENDFGLKCIVKTKMIENVNHTIWFRGIRFDETGTCLVYSAAPAGYKPELSCIIGLEEFGTGSGAKYQSITKKCFFNEFEVENNGLSCHTNAFRFIFALDKLKTYSDLTDDGKFPQTFQMEPSSISKNILPNSVVCPVTKKLIMPTNDNFWLSPDSSENMQISSSWNYQLIKTSKNSLVVLKVNESEFAPNVKFLVKDFQLADQKPELLETILLTKETKDLQDQYKTERELIQNKMNNLIEEIKETKKNNSALQEIEKIDPSEIVLDVSIISKRENQKMYAAQKLEYELKNRIAIALAKEQLIDAHCNSDYIQRDGKIKYLNSSKKSYGQFYENKSNQIIENILNSSEVIISDWQNLLNEEYRIQASAMTEQQQKELDEAEAKGGDSKDELMQKMASRSTNLGAKKEHFLPQLWLLDGKSREDQRKLITSAVHAIRDDFNRRAKKTFERKENEVRQHEERVVRRNEIIKEFATVPDALKLLADFDNSNFWTISNEERPEKITNVDLNDIDAMLENSCPGLFDIEQRKASRENKSNQVEEEDSEAKKTRLRALIDMMDGVLEIKDDIFATEIPKPKFMFGDSDGDGIVPENEWDEEQKKLAKNYEKKCQVLDETRIKYKQQLLSEAKKLIETDTQSALNYDSALNSLCHQKSDADAEQHSLLLRGSRLELIDEHGKALERKQAHVRDILNKFVDWDEANLKIVLDHSINQFKTKMEQVLQEEKALEKTFKKDFLSDVAVCDGPIEEYTKVFKNHKLSYELRLIDFGIEVAQKNPVEISNLIIDTLLNRKPDVVKLVQKEIPNYPGQTNEHTENFIELLQNKFEADIRRKTLEYMSNHCLNLIKLLETERDLYNSQRQNIEDELSTIDANIQKNFLANLPVQILIREGLCQLDGTDMTSGQEYAQCTLVEKHEIETLNEQILLIGKKKLDEMKKSIQFKQQIRLNQWELQRLTMKKEDLQEQIRHIQLFKLSKDVQKQIEMTRKENSSTGNTIGGSSDTNSDNNADKQKRMTNIISKLEKRLAVQQRMQENQKKTLKKKANVIKIESQAKSSENSDLHHIIEHLAHTVAEKKLLDDASRERAGQMAKKKMQIIVKRRQLVETVKQQAQDLAMLQNELERMRMRTFPALTTEK